MREVAGWLATEHRLLLHETKSHVRRVTEGVTFLGFHVWPTHRRVRPENVVRARRRVRALNVRFARGLVDVAAVRASLMSWTGHTKHAHARELERRVLRGVSLRHGNPA
jgi:hypothetical protein